MLLENNLDVIPYYHVLCCKISGPLSYQDESAWFHYCEYNQYYFASKIFRRAFVSRIFFLNILLVFPNFYWRKRQIYWRGIFRIYLTNFFGTVQKINIIHKIISCHMDNYFVWHFFNDFFTVWWSIVFLLVPLGQVAL